MTSIDAMLMAARTQLHEGTDALVLPPFVRAAASSDDLWVDERRQLVRVSLVPGDGGAPWVVDLRDSSTATDVVAIDRELAMFAAISAFSDALGLPHADRRLASSIELLTDDGTWVGRTPTGDTSARLFGTARVFDAIRGALALAWPDGARAGSCSLGAIVVLGDTFVDVVPGGRGASTAEHGAHAWPGPVLLAGPQSAPPSTITVHRTPRTGSGGGGARIGGDGVVARYELSAATRVHVAMDRITNPPHGLDRAGPPERAELVRIDQDGTEHPLRAWTTTTLAAGETLEVRTSGGAGQGFPGWGDIVWDPSAFGFG